MAKNETEPPADGPHPLLNGKSVQLDIDRIPISRIRWPETFQDFDASLRRSLRPASAQLARIALELDPDDPRPIGTPHPLVVPHNRSRAATALDILGVDACTGRLEEFTVTQKSPDDLNRTIRSELYKSNLARMCAEGILFFELKSVLRQPPARIRPTRCALGLRIAVLDGDNFTYAPVYSVKRTQGA